MFDPKCTAMIAVAAVVLISGVRSVLSADQDKAAATDYEAALQQAEQLAAERDQLGEKLLTLLTDGGTTLEERIQHLRTLESLAERRKADKRYMARLDAIDRLGKLQYRRAIPALIKYRHLMPPRASESIPPPAVDALAQFGDGAVPQIVEACLAEETFLIAGGVRKGRSIFSLYMALKQGKTFRTARIYAQGIAATNQDPEMKQKVALFLKQLDKYDGD